MTEQEKSEGSVGEAERAVRSGGSRRGRIGPVLRQEQVAEYVLNHGSVSAKDLAGVFGVSTMTIHRDLDELAQQGVLRKVRGAAEPRPTSLFESNVRYRIRAAREEKLAVCRHAVRQVEPGQSVMLDDSTTTLPLAKLLQQVTPLTVITNFRMGIDELTGARGINLTSLGGEYLSSHDAFVGIVCEAAISSLRADVLFMSSPAVSECHAMHQEQDIVRIKRAMMAAARRKVLLIDHHKLEKSALHMLAPLTDFDLVVVDSGADPQTLENLRDCGAPVEVAQL